MRKLAAFIEDRFYRLCLDRRFDIGACIIVLISLAGFFGLDRIAPGYGAIAPVGILIGALVSFRTEIRLTLYRRTRWSVFSS